MSVKKEELTVPEEEFERRIRRTLEFTRDREFDSLLIFGGPFYDRLGNFSYLTNHFPPFPTCVWTEGIKGLGYAALLLPVDSEPVMVVDTPNYRKNLVSISDVRVTTNFVEAMEKIIVEKGMQKSRIGLVSEDIIPLKFYQEMLQCFPGIRWENATEIVSSQRVIKSEKEIALLKEAVQIASEGLKEALSIVKENITENEVSAAGLSAAIRAGADFIRYLRVHSGPWSSWSTRWPPATDRILQKGDIVCIDLIGAYKGYQFDLLRTTAVGKPNPEHRNIMEASLNATQMVVENIRTDASVEDLTEIAFDTIAKAGYERFAAGFIGHGIGLETVEDPYLVRGAKGKLKEGMVLCVEPGIFIPEVGGSRVEQEVIVRKDGAELISTLEARLW